MSQLFQAWFVNTAQSNTSIAALLGKDSTGAPAVFPYHGSDADPNVPFPHITLANFGSATERGMFDDSPLHATRVEGFKLAVCVWSRTTVDECHAIYNLVDDMLRGPSANPNNVGHFTTYGLKRISKRDDLWDDKLLAYHLHSEYVVWVRYATTPPS
jgi:hypothetical protein